MVASQCTTPVESHGYHTRNNPVGMHICSGCDLRKVIIYVNTYRTASSHRIFPKLVRHNRHLSMGNSASNQAGMIAAKTKMSGALSSMEGTLNLKNKDNARREPKTRQKEWNDMHKETAKL